MNRFFFILGQGKKEAMCTAKVCIHACVPSQNLKKIEVKKFRCCDPKLVGGGGGMMFEW